MITVKLVKDLVVGDVVVGGEEALARGRVDSIGPVENGRRWVTFALEDRPVVGLTDYKTVTLDAGERVEVEDDDCQSLRLADFTSGDR